jgi:uncharacterized protein DUF6985
MFSKKIEHPLFQELERGLLGYSGKLNDVSLNKADVTIRGRSKTNLKFTENQLPILLINLPSLQEQATEEAYASYEIIKEVVDSGEFDLEAEGGNLPDISIKSEVWKHMVLENIIIEPDEKYPIRLGYRAPWDIEHDFGIYVVDGKYEYSGISV